MKTPLSVAQVHALKESEEQFTQFSPVRFPVDDRLDEDPMDEIHNIRRTGFTSSDDMLAEFSLFGFEDESDVPFDHDSFKALCSASMCAICGEPFAPTDSREPYFDDYEGKHAARCKLCSYAFRLPSEILESGVFPITITNNAVHAEAGQSRAYSQVERANERLTDLHEKAMDEVDRVEKERNEIRKANKNLVCNLKYWRNKATRLQKTLEKQVLRNAEVIDQLKALHLLSDDRYKQIHEQSEDIRKQSDATFRRITRKYANKDGSPPLPISDHEISQMVKNGAVVIQLFQEK